MKSNRELSPAGPIFYPPPEVALTVILRNHIFPWNTATNKEYWWPFCGGGCFSPPERSGLAGIDLLILGALVVWILDKLRRNLIPQVCYMRTRICDIYISTGARLCGFATYLYCAGLVESDIRHHPRLLAFAAAHGSRPPRVSANFTAHPNTRYC